MPEDDIRRQPVEVSEVKDQGVPTSEELKKGTQRSTARLKARAKALQKKSHK